MGEPTRGVEKHLPFLLETQELGSDDDDGQSLHDRIEKFRSPYQRGDLLKPNEWRNLLSRIAASFTRQQLLQYTSVHGRPDASLIREVTNDSSANIDTDVDVKNSNAPEVVSVDGVEPLVAREVVEETQSLLRKEAMAEAVLRDCWQLGITSDLGRVDICLQRPWIFLLMNSKSSNLKEFASTCGARVEAWLDLKLVRVTGTKHACQAVSKTIEEAGTRIKAEFVQLTPLGRTDPFQMECLRRNLHRPFLRWINFTYGVFAMNKGNSHISKMIYYFAEDHKYAEDARRTLNLVASESLHGIIPYSTHVYPDNVDRARLGRNASWLDRRKTWHRGVTLAKREDVSCDGIDTVTHSNNILASLKMWARDEGIKQFGPNVRQILTAKVGRSLCSIRKPSDDKTVEASGLDPLEKKRIFNSDIPQVTKFLRSVNPLNSNAYEQTYLAELTPSALYSRHLPQLVLEVSVREEMGFPRQVRLSSVRSVFREHKADYLLPECGLDVRFSRVVYRDLLSELPKPSSRGSQGMEPFFDALRGCIETLFASEGDATTSLPAFWHIPVPKVLQPYRGPNLYMASEKWKDSNGTIMGQYIVPPFENILLDSRITHYDFYGKRLTYRNYRAGPFFPQQTVDLFLSVAVPDGDTESREMTSREHECHNFEKEFHSFFKTACQLAYEVDAAGCMEREDIVEHKS